MIEVLSVVENEVTHAQQRMNDEFDWRECTQSERLSLADGKKLPNNVYKLLSMKKTKKGIAFFCWFDGEEIQEVIVNDNVCHSYDVTDVWRDLV